MNNQRKNNGLFHKRIHKYDIFLNSVPALPCDFLRKGSGGMSMQVSLTQFTTFPLRLKGPNCKADLPFPSVIGLKDGCHAPCKAIPLFPL